MNYRPQTHSRPSAFTLVELLTVITIIAILMGLLFPAIGIAKDQARKAETRTAVMGITTAVKAYYTEYGKYPLGAQVASNPNADVIFGVSQNYTPSPGGGGSNQQLFDILRNVQSAPGTPNPYNPRAIVFFDGKTVSDPNAPKSGFIPANAATGGIGKTPGAYMDPWGNEYFIAIDGDYDNTISNLPYTEFRTGGSSGTPMTGVCVFSIGKDGVVGDKKFPNQYRSGSNTADDILSWQ